MNHLEYSQAKYNPCHYYNSDPELKQVLDMISSGFFSPDDPDRFRPITEALLDHGDTYRLMADFRPYIEAQEAVENLYRNGEQWTRKSILNVARMGKFSSDRTIREYAEEIWGAKPVPVTRGEKKKK